MGRAARAHGTNTPPPASCLHIARSTLADVMLQANETEVKKQMDDMRAELGSALNSHLSAAERSDLSRLAPELERMQVRSQGFPAMPAHSA